mmetsp:Transcript_3284/g.7542  ORF Transcript_3284/g.7542 Transcript_3284/m.7542 type:complete len:277 (-) Transcript_3284:260-1090(-)
MPDPELVHNRLDNCVPAMLPGLEVVQHVGADKLVQYLVASVGVATPPTATGEHAVVRVPFCCHLTDSSFLLLLPFGCTKRSLLLLQRRTNLLQDAPILHLVPTPGAIIVVALLEESSAIPNSDLLHNPNANGGPVDHIGLGVLPTGGADDAKEYVVPNVKVSIPDTEQDVVRSRFCYQWTVSFLLGLTWHLLLPLLLQGIANLLPGEHIIHLVPTLLVPTPLGGAALPEESSTISGPNLIHDGIDDGMPAGVPAAAALAATTSLGGLEVHSAVGVD